MFPVLQFTVCLQSEESLAEECQRTPGQGIAIVSYGKQVQFCLFAERIHVILPIPLHVAPGFLTDLGRKSVGADAVGGVRIAFRNPQLATLKLMSLIYDLNFRSEDCADFREIDFL